MEELVTRVAEATGLSSAQAQSAVNAVLDYLKQQLPAPVASQLEGLLEGGDGLKSASNLVQGLGGMFGVK